MTTLQFDFTPEIVFFGSKDEDYPEIGSQNYPTASQSLNIVLLEGIENDRINFQHTFKANGFAVQTYQFSPQDNRIHIVVQSAQPVDAQKLADLISNLKIEDSGPESGDFSIADEDLAEEFGYGWMSLVPKLSQVILLTPQANGAYSQQLIDISQLPAANE